jgi:predicted MFS family arabinose efflux permease
MSLVIPQTAMQRVIPNAVLGRVSAVFLTGEAAATLTGAVAGPFIAQAAHLTGVVAAASLITLSAAALTFLIVPRMSKIIPDARQRRSRAVHRSCGAGGGRGRAGRLAYRSDSRQYRRAASG